MNPPLLLLQLGPHGPLLSGDVSPTPLPGACFSADSPCSDQRSLPNASWGRRMPQAKQVPWPRGLREFTCASGERSGGSGMALRVGRALTGCPQPHPPRLGWRAVAIRSPVFLLEWQARDLSPWGASEVGGSVSFQQRSQAESPGRLGAGSPLVVSKAFSSAELTPRSCFCLDCPPSHLCLGSFYLCWRSNSHVTSSESLP